MKNKLLLAALAIAAFLIVGATWAVARDDAVPPPPAQPTSADQIQNIDQVKTAIKAYYGDTPTSTPSPDNPAVTLHQFSATGAYAQEMAGLEQDAEHYLADQAKHLADQAKQTADGHGPCAKDGGKTPPPPHPTPVPGPSPNPAGKCGTPAILFDVDDTTLNTYSYEIYSNFVYNPTTNAAFVTANPPVFPAVPGMPDLVNQARAEGYTILFLTGRPVSQAAATLANLKTAGYGDIPPEDLFTKTPNYPEPRFQSCAPSCSTSQYKTLTRQYIETQLGFDIVANFGDQFSDLVGDFADRTFKLPNPMYFLP